ncbi:unnamed protein product [Rangifer tarandus platyrhynchus]|uniref:Uncharacterized protein n=1 Tax=Rangifer tarandus platyrhynchus TaxID=3082113 RepID=A0ABN8XL43_RANTA|nr:unnamed protein product [Rangifer tarandus platyrhynchus]
MSAHVCTGLPGSTGQHYVDTRINREMKTGRYVRKEPAAYAASDQLRSTPPIRSVGLPIATSKDSPTHRTRLHREVIRNLLVCVAWACVKPLLPLVSVRVSVKIAARWYSLACRFAGAVAPLRQPGSTTKPNVLRNTDEGACQGCLEDSCEKLVLYEAPHAGERRTRNNQSLITKAGHTRKLHRTHMAFIIPPLCQAGCRGSRTFTIQLRLRFYAQCAARRDRRPQAAPNAVGTLQRLT